MTLLETHQRKATILLKIANAIEDSTARQRASCHNRDRHHGAQRRLDKLPASVQQALELKDGDGTVVTEESSVMDYENYDEDEESPHVEEQKSEAEEENAESDRHVQGVSSCRITTEQIQQLYAAVTSHREHADLKYQTLEIRYLDLSQAFFELEAKYRRIQAERDELKSQKQQVFTIHTPDSWTTSHTNNLLKNNHMLQSQRDKLIHVNLELRKQLATGKHCPTCRPAQCSAAERSPWVVQAMMEEVQMTSTTTAADHQQELCPSNDGNQDVEEEDSLEGKERSMGDTLTNKSATRRHDGNMALLGAHFSTQTRPARRVSVTASTLNPSSSVRCHSTTSHLSPSFRGRCNKKRTPAFTNKQPSSMAGDRSGSMSHFGVLDGFGRSPSTKMLPGLPLNEDQNETSAAQEQIPTGGSGGMDRFGMLDEFGRSLSKKHIVAATNEVGTGEGNKQKKSSKLSTHGAPSTSGSRKHGGIALFRRKPPVER